MAHYKGIHHMAMATKDMDQTILFWRDLLGMRLVAGLGKKDYKHYFFEISENNFISFFHWTDVEPMPEKDHGYPVTGPFIFDHVAFEVETEEELWNLKDRLTAAGFWVSEAMDHGFIHSIYAFDPNGIPIEFCTNVVGVDIRNRPRLVDSAPSELALEGPEPHTDRRPRVEEPTPLQDRKVYPGEGGELVEGKKNWWEEQKT